MSTNDLRTQLSSSGAPRVAGANVEPQYFEFAKMEPTVTTPAGSRQWWVRSQAMVIAYLELAADDVLSIEGQPDEYTVLVPEDSGSITIRAGGDEAEAAAGSLAVVPSGDSSIEAPGGATIVGVFSSQSDSLTRRCTNAAFYHEPDPNVAPWAPWPAATGGERLRIYDVAGVEPEQGRFGRLYRCSTVMVNWFYTDDRPRPRNRMSPHHHDDFEQISLQLAGDYVHHIRTPWTADLEDWHEDEHHLTTSPSVTIIPPPSVHTSQSIEEMPHLLIDLFAPPRADFSSRPEWILNGDDYPLPS